MRVLKPKVVDVDPSIVSELMREEHEVEKRRYRRVSRDYEVVLDLVF